VIVFSPLTSEEVGQIAKMQLDRLTATVAARGKELAITDEAVAAIVKEGHSVAYGARFLKRVIDDRVKIPLSQIWGTADRFRVAVVDGSIAVTTAADSGAAAEAEPFAGVA
jgi:ATP-dependent Clp protease ATP-binding subunit ClpA